MKSVDENNILESNVANLLETGGDAPRLGDGARSRIRAHLIEKHGLAQRTRSPLIAIGLGLAATAAGAMIVTRIAGDPDLGGEVTRDPNRTDGASWIVDGGGKVTKLGARKLRVEGAALIDVEPGKGAFTVETARGTIEVIGTRFLVDAQQERTTAAVIRGVVKLASDAGNVTLHAGEQGIAEHGRPPTRGPAPRLSHLVSWAAQARRKMEHNAKPLRNGTLFAREPNNPSVPETPLPIVKLGVDVVVEDQVARVAIDQTFHNPNVYVMEGMYRFAIPPDSSLQRLAMYVDGTLTESAVVERMAARRIYEDVVYRRLDPALLEWAGTGRLSLKVYPLPAQQDKRLLIAYTQSLPKLYDDYTLAVPLPEVDLPVGELAFDVRMKGCANCEIMSTSHKVKVERSGNDAIVSYREGRAEIGDSLVLKVRDKRKEPILASHTSGDGQFVMVRARPDLKTTAREYRKRTWVILDDVSASRDVFARRAQHDMIDGFLRELDEDDRIAIISFDVAARTKLAPTRVLDVDRKTVRAALNEEGGIGATDFGVALDAALETLKGVAPDDATIVYLGDGIISSGPRQLDKLRDRIVGKAQFVGVGIGDGPDTQTLDSLAAATGGYATTIDLADDVRWRAFDLVAALHTSRVAGLTGKLVDASGSRIPATVYIKTPQLADGEELELVAKIASTSPVIPAAIELSGTLNGRPWQQRVPFAGAAEMAGYLPRLWAQRHIGARLLQKHEPVVVPPCVAPVVTDTVVVPTRGGPKKPTEQLVCKTEHEVREARDEEIRKDIIALGKQFFLLSRHTSLLVLENDEMYKKYNVTKGSGDTWAPYKVPDKIPVVTGKLVAPTIDVAPDAELVRRPLQIFYTPTYYDPNTATLDGRWTRQRAIEAARTSGTLGFTTTRDQVFRMPQGEAQTAQPGPRAPAPDATIVEGKMQADKQDLERADQPARKMVLEEASEKASRDEDSGVELAKNKQAVVFADDLGGVGRVNGTGSGYGVGGRRGDRFGATIVGGKGYYHSRSLALAGPMYPQRLGYATDTAYDDLTEFMPALTPDMFDSWRGELQLTSAGKNKLHAIDAQAKSTLEAARKAVPSGIYRWGDREIAVDAAHRIGWRRTTATDLAETASFDGATWTRRYAELGVDITRTLAEEDVAFALAYLPVWIAEPSHYAKWFEVRSGKRRGEVELYRPGQKGKKAALAYVLELDQSHHLTAIRDAKGDTLLLVTWGAVGPSKVKTYGQELAVGFSGLPITDATSWAHGNGVTGVAIEMPMHLSKYWDDKAQAHGIGSSQWRHAQRQKMASQAAINDRGGVFATYELLRANGGVELGDLVLASGGIGSTSDAQAQKSVDKLASTTVGQYLLAGRAYAYDQKPEKLKAKVSTGFIGALWTVREVVALFQHDKSSLGVERLLSLGERAPELRMVGVGATTNRYRMKPSDIVRVWDSVATGSYKNVARAHAAQLLAARGQYDAAADRVVSLVASLDLDAAPPNLQNIQYYFQSSRRGPAGWQLVWAMWRDRVLAGSSYEHVLSLLGLGSAHPIDMPAILGRAAALAGDDPDRIVQVARLAMTYGHAAYGHSLVEPLVKKHPTRELHQLVGGIALSQGKHADALAHLEKAFELGGDEAVNLATLRQELLQIIGMARQLAVQSQGADRTKAVKRALAWGAKWRAIDSGNPQIAQTLGDLLLAVGDTREAWRHLSTVIERDPMSGDGYATVAQAFETQGRVAEAVDFWHQSLILDQTNPTPRLRKAQALIALGKTVEGDALLADIVGRKWHVRWDNVVYQVKALIERSKQPRPTFDE